jgi:translation initiation factor IF-2
MKNNFNSITVIIEEGILRIGSFVVIGNQQFKIRTMVDDRGVEVKEASPGEAVQIFGVSFTPYPGDQIIEVRSLQEAKTLADKSKRSY